MLRLPLAVLAALLLAAPARAQADSLDALIEAAHAAGTFDGIVLVGRGDRVVYRRAVGLADRSWGVLNAADTRFPWASITKQLTAAVVLQLVDEERLTLNTSLGDILTGLRLDHAGRVTIRQLLTNSSGLPHEESLDPAYTTRSDSVAATVIDRALAADLDFEPGSTFRYTNTDYRVLERVIEAITGMSYAEVLQARILDPLGMTETALVRDDRVEPRLPAGYLGEAGAARPMPATRLATYGAAGALAGPVDDLFRFDRALLSDRLFSLALRDSMFAANDALGYVALSVWSYSLPVDGEPVALVERQGWIWGYRGLNLLAPDKDLVLIVLSNNGAADLSQTYDLSSFSASLLRAALAVDA